MLIFLFFLQRGHSNLNEFWQHFENANVFNFFRRSVHFENTLLKGCIICTYIFPVLLFAYGLPFPTDKSYGERAKVTYSTDTFVYIWRIRLKYIFTINFEMIKIMELGLRNLSLWGQKKCRNYLIFIEHICLSRSLCASEEKKKA